MAGPMLLTGQRGSPPSSQAFVGGALTKHFCSRGDLISHLACIPPTRAFYRHRFSVPPAGWRAGILSPGPPPGCLPVACRDQAVLSSACCATPHMPLAGLFSRTECFTGIDVRQCQLSVSVCVWRVGCCSFYQLAACDLPLCPVGHLRSRGTLPRNASPPYPLGGSLPAGCLSTQLLLTCLGAVRRGVYAAQPPEASGCPHPWA